MKTKQLAVLCFALLALIASVEAADFHVATDGNDANPGTQQKPFATISRARDAVREKIAAGLQDDLTVEIHGGKYSITEPIAFGPEDGGAGQFEVTYAAASGEQPVITGGRVITGWKADADGTWSAVIPEVAAGKLNFRQLYVNSRRATRARYPNEGYLRVEKVGEDRRTNFQYKPGDLRAYDGVQQIELVFLHDWSITRVPLQSIDEATQTVKVVRQIGGPSSWAVMDWFEKKPRYYLENAAEFLDAPGEWFLDRDSGKLTYCPRPGEKIEEIEVVAPVAKQLLVVRGDPASDRLVRHLNFVGLELEHAAWFPPDNIYWGRQACTYWSPNTVASGRSHEEADPAAVQFDLTESCSFRNGKVSHAGASGIWLGRGCQRNLVLGTTVSDTGGNGIMVGEGQVRQVGDQPWWEVAPEQAAVGNLVLHNLVQHSGRDLFGAVGIWVGLAGKTTIMQNEVRHHPYTGVSIGWMWWNPRSRPQPRKTPCEQTIVENNHIHHVMQTLSDGGGIYSLGSQPGSALRGNLIHDVSPNVGRAESNGMFLDQGTGQFVIENNVIYNVDRSPLRFHKGWENLVRKNVLEVKSGIPVVRYNDTLQERIVLEDNLIVEKVGQEVIEAALQRVGPKAEDSR